MCVCGVLSRALACDTQAPADEYSPGLTREIQICSADGSTHTESNKLYRKVKHRYRPNLSPRQRPTAKSRHYQAALAASAGAGSHTPSTASESFSHVNRYAYMCACVLFMHSRGSTRAQGSPERST